MKQRIALIALIALCLAPWLSAAVPATDHSHLNVVFELRADDISAKGDSMGVYAVELLACAGGAVGERKAAASAVVGPAPRVDGALSARRVIETALAALSGTAHANHRDRFDGPSSREFMQPVPLDKASRTSLGEMLTSFGQYCQVRITLARLPSTPTRPALPFALRLSGRTGTELKIEFRETVLVSLKEPWRAAGQSAELTIRLRPRAAAALIPSEIEDFGVISQRAMQKLAQETSAEIAAR